MSASAAHLLSSDSEYAIVTGATLLANSYFQDFSKVEIANLQGCAVRCAIAAGQTLFAQGARSLYVYWIEEGEIDLSAEGQLRSTKQAGFIGLDGAAGYPHYKETATVREHAVVLRIELSALENLAHTNFDLLKKLFIAYETRHTQSKPHAATKWRNAVAKASTRNATEGVGMQIFGWLLAVVLPALVYRLSTDHGLNPQAVTFLAIVSCTVVMWVFGLVPAFIPPLFCMLATILFNIVPAQVAASGFASDSFFILLSVFAIGALMIMSGLTYRISLYFLKWAPASPFGHNIFLFFYGLILTPLIPAHVARATIMQPFLSTLINAVGHKKKNPVVAQLVFSGVAGISLMPSIFLTGNATNMILYGLLDTQVQSSFSWMPWLAASSVTGVVLLTIYLLIARFLFENKETYSISKEVIHSQIRTLGNMSAPEWSALTAISLLVLGILTIHLHQIELTWLALAILVTFLLLGSIKSEVICKHIDWATLIFIATMVAWEPIIQTIGLEEIMFGSLGWVALEMKMHFTWFIILLSIATILIRLVLPEPVTAILLFSLLLPMARQAEISPWIVGFVILTMSSVSIFSYQEAHHYFIQEQLAELGQDELYEEHRVIFFNILLAIANVIAIAAAIPFWKFIGLS